MLSDPHPCPHGLNDSLSVRLSISTDITKSGAGNKSFISSWTFDYCTTLRNFLRTGTGQFRLHYCKPELAHAQSVAIHTETAMDLGALVTTRGATSCRQMPTCCCQVEYDSGSTKASLSSPLLVTCGSTVVSVLASNRKKRVDGLSQQI